MRNEKEAHPNESLVSIDSFSLIVILNSYSFIDIRAIQTNKNNHTKKGRERDAYFNNLEQMEFKKS